MPTQTPEDELDEYLARTRPLAKKDNADSTALAILQTDDGFAQAAAEANRNLLKGEILKFLDGVWSVGGQTVPRDAKYVVTHVLAAWVRWEDKKPAQYEFARPSGMLPHRDALSHLDQADWPAGVDGEPSDPWRNTRFVYLLNPATAETFTATNSTVGMRAAYEALGKAVSTMRKVH